MMTSVRAKGWQVEVYEQKDDKLKNNIQWSSSKGDNKLIVREHDEENQWSMDYVISTKSGTRIGPSVNKIRTGCERKLNKNVDKRPQKVRDQ